MRPEEVIQSVNEGTVSFVGKFCQLNALEEVIQSVNEGPISFAGKFYQ